MVFDWQTAVYVAGGTAVTIGTLWGKFKKADPELANTIETYVAHSVPHGLATFGEEAFQFVEHIAESPLFAGKVEAGKLEAQHVIDQLNQTTAVSEAKTILLGIGKVYSALTPDEKVKVEVLLKLALSALGVHLNDAQIQSVFAEAQTAIDALRNQAFYKAAFEAQQSA